MPQPRRTFDSTKLIEHLPKLVGKTISQAVISEHLNNRIQFYLLFTDGTAYEFYTEGWLSGARGLERGTVDEVLARSRSNGSAQRVAPDRRRVPRDENAPRWEPPGRPADDGDGDGDGE